MGSNKPADLPGGEIEQSRPPFLLSTGVSEALAWMERSGEVASVVMDGGRPVGVITARALRSYDIHGGAPPDGGVEQVMDFEVVRVDPSCDVADTLRLYRDAAWLSVRRRHPVARQPSVH